MPNSCVAFGNINGVYVQTWSGHIDSPICNVRDQSDIRHFVKVVNIRAYPIAVHCKGTIPNNSRLIEFSCGNYSDKKSTWEASIKRLGDGKDYTFNPCTLNPTSEINGTETIITEVTISDFKSNKDDSRSLEIKVDV